MPGYYHHFLICISAVLFIISAKLKKNFFTLPFLYLGKISYSLFLIHWPVIVIFNYYYIQNYGLEIKIILSIFILVISHLSWKHIENRYLYKNIKNIRINFLKYILIMFPILLIVFSFNQKKINKLDENFYQFISSENSEKILSNLINNKVQNFESTIHIFGDSHATDTASSIYLNNEKLEYNINLQNIDISCIKGRNNYLQQFKNKVTSKNCIKGQETFQEIYLNKINNKDILIFSFYWQKKHLKFLKNFIKFVELNNNNQIYLMMQIPIIRNISVSNLKEIKNFQKYTYNSLEKKKNYNIEIKEILKDSNVIEINVSEKICNNIKKKCFVKKKNKSLYFDKHHWTLDGEKFYGKYIVEILSKNRAQNITN